MTIYVTAVIAFIACALGAWVGHIATSNLPDVGPGTCQCGHGECYHYNGIGICHFENCTCQLYFAVASESGQKNPKGEIERL